MIAGTFLSRRLAARPTPDRLRRNPIPHPCRRGLETPAGLEALRGGAALAWFPERYRRPLGAIRKNLGAIEVERRATLLVGKVLVTLERWPTGVVFLAP